MMIIMHLISVLVSPQLFQICQRDIACSIYSFAITSFLGHKICKKEIIWTQKNFKGNLKLICGTAFQ